MQEIVDAEKFLGFGGGDAGVGGQAIKMIEAIAGRPRRKSCFALKGEVFLEAIEILAGAGIARRNGAPGTGIAAFEMNLADGEANDAAFVLAEELIFPEGGNAMEFEGGAEALANVFEREAGKGRALRWRCFGARADCLGTRGKPLEARGKPIGHGLEGCGGDDSGTVGDGIVGKSVGRVADDNLLLKENAEPFGSVFEFAGESEGARGEIAAIVGDGERDGRQVRGIVCANEMDGRGAFAIDPFAVDGIQGPGAVEGESARRPDAGFRDGNGIERFDGMQANVG